MSWRQTIFRGAFQATGGVLGAVASYSFPVAASFSARTVTAMYLASQMTNPNTLMAKFAIKSFAEHAGAQAYQTVAPAGLGGMCQFAIAGVTVGVTAGGLAYDMCPEVIDPALEVGGKLCTAMYDAGTSVASSLWSGISSTAGTIGNAARLTFA